MNLDEEKKVEVVMIIEVMGRPPEHLVETLNKIIESLEKEKGVKVMEKKVYEPRLMKDKNDLYTNFAEILVQTNTITEAAMIMFRYMPSHIEFLSPDKMTISNVNWNELMNELMQRLHRYDEIAKVIQIEKVILEKKLRELLESKKNKEEQGNDKEKAENKPEKKRK